MIRVKEEEASIVVDVAELQRTRDSLKSRILSVADDPPTFNFSAYRKDCHWDFVVKEVCWLAEDFQRERARHNANAKKVIKATEAYCKTADQRKLKKSKEEVIALKRVAARISRDVRKYWLKINQLITLRQKQESDDIRQKAMDKHLEFLVKQTERYSSMVSDQYHRGGADDQDDDSTSTSSGEGIGESDFSTVAKPYVHAPKRRRVHSDCSQSMVMDYVDGDEDSDGSSFAVSEDEVDDETTLLEQEEAERRDGALSNKSEVAMLEDEAILPVEELMKRYGYQAAASGEFVLPGQDSLDDEPNPANDDESEDEDDASFTASEEEDDETTLLEQEDVERRERQTRGDDDDEVAQLAAEADMSVEELARKYGYSGGAGGRGYVLPEESDDDADEAVGESDVDKNKNEDEVMDASISDHVASDEDESFKGSDSEDDETTLLEQEEEENRERLARGGDHGADDDANELAVLKNEADMSIEELAKKYGYHPSSNGKTFALQYSDAESLSEGSVGRDEKLDASPSASASEDESFVGSDEEDDETTLLEQEELERQARDAGNGDGAEDELALLRDEAEMSLEELRRRCGYPAPDEIDLDDHEAHEKSASETEVAEENNAKDEDEDEDEDDASFTASEEEDDETTLLEQEEVERRERQTRGDDDDEVAQLAAEADMSVEELARKYGYSGGAGGRGYVLPEESDDDADEAVGESDNEEAMDIASDTSFTRAHRKTRKRGASTDTSSVLSATTSCALRPSISDRLAQMDAQARSVRMPLPFILRNINLREYQHVGMSWLISLHDRRLNGILADEMGLGKTIQTIAALAYLAIYKGIWGPHLIIVPTSCIINWECELKRFCPAFKILTYFGTAKQRKALRVGWSKLNSFHVCITSYQIVLSDQNMFRRKKWYYMILDEAHHIKNYMSKKWQALLGFNTFRRLLLSGTPLQNNVLELWSLLHFLMPYLFNSRKEFAYWFADPLNKITDTLTTSRDDPSTTGAGTAAGGPSDTLIPSGGGGGIVSRLHTIIRPFILRRLKSEVATQLPNKYEYILNCKMSKRQLYLYEEFIGKQGHSSNSYISMMNVLMQLRKICNHPDLLEPRLIDSPLIYEGVSLAVPQRLVDLSQADARTSVSAKHIVLTDGAVWPVFVQDMHLEALQAAQASQGVQGGAVSGHTRPLPARLLRCLDAVMARLRKQASASSSTGLLPRLVPSYTSLLQSQLLPCIRDVLEDRLHPQTRPQCEDSSRAGIIEIEPPGRRVVAALRRRQAWRRVTLHDSLMQHLAQLVGRVCERFLVVVPRVLSPTPRLVTKAVQANTLTALIRPGHDALRLHATMTRALAHAKLMQNICIFPDKKLVQYDCGKLTLLAQLLHKIKHSADRGVASIYGHAMNKVLIFTQMSRMLDILEVFLNLNHHTFLRLDGTTEVTQRQRLMDQFNNDPKIFVFILSTRSGGLGINLTGANHVIFYDTDWNPAMDAQAQDRAHRIGQTRDVHIYRLITESSVEENILLKNRQKKKLDVLVMNQGQFQEPYAPYPTTQVASAGEDAFVDAYDRLLGSGGGATVLNALEDAEDVQMLNKANEEMKEEMNEFSEAAGCVGLAGTGDEAADEAADADGPDPDGPDAEGVTAAPTKAKPSSSATGVDADVVASTSVVVAAPPAVTDERAVEEEFQRYLTSNAGASFASLLAQLHPVDHYALRYRTVEDTFVSIYYVHFAQKQHEMATLASQTAGEMNVAEVEQRKADEERLALVNGEVISTLHGLRSGSSRRIQRLVQRWRRWFLHERRQKVIERKRIAVLGLDWHFVFDPHTRTYIYQNATTLQVSYSPPDVVVRNDEYRHAAEKRFGGLPIAALQAVYGCMDATARLRGAAVCTQWRRAAQSSAYVHKVVSVEHIAEVSASRAQRTTHSVAAALAVAQAGEHVCLQAGHHWESSLRLTRPLYVFADDLSDCVLELAGGLRVARGVRVLLRNVTIRTMRSSEATDPLDATIVVEPGAVFMAANVTIQSFTAGHQSAELVRVEAGGRAFLQGSQLLGGLRAAVVCESGAHALLSGCRFAHYAGGALGGGTGGTIFCADTVFAGMGAGTGVAPLLAPDCGAEVLALHCDLRLVDPEELRRVAAHQCLLPGVLAGTAVAGTRDDEEP